MVDDAALKTWFLEEVLPLEPSLTRFIRRNWRVAEDVTDIRQDVYTLVLSGARSGLPMSSAAYVHTIARNHLINLAKRARIVSFELIAELEGNPASSDLFQTERQLSARDELRHAQAGLEKLPPRCRDVVRLRKVEGLSTREAAERLGVGMHTIERQLTLGMRALTDHMLGGTGRIVRPRQQRRQDRGRDA